LFKILEESNLRKDRRANLECHMAENISFIGFFGQQISKTVCDSFQKKQAKIDVHGRGVVAARFPKFRARWRRVV